MSISDIEVLHQKECPHAVEYLKNPLKGMFAQVEMWLATGVVAPKTTSRLERLFRELGRLPKNPLCFYRRIAQCKKTSSRNDQQGPTKCIHLSPLPKWAMRSSRLVCFGGFP